MKKTLKRIFMSVVAAALIPVLVSCINISGTVNKDPNKNIFRATVTKASGNSFSVVPVDEDFTISFKSDDFSAAENDTVVIKYDNYKKKRNGATITVLEWWPDRRNITYSSENAEVWLDLESEDVESCGSLICPALVEKVYSDCVICKLANNQYGYYAADFFKNGATGKLNITEGVDVSNLMEGMMIQVTCRKSFHNDTDEKYEADLVTYELVTSYNRDMPIYAEKPVIYLYPEEETEVRVELELSGGELTCTYPEYGNGWEVTARPDGTLTDAEGREYNYLYWEATTGNVFDFSKGFCVRGSDTAAFLEEKLEALGLTRREANEFIIYWLPLMQNNEYNVISFQSEAYTDYAKMTVSPEPDTQIRVFMAWKATDEFTQIEPQEIATPERTGFTLVEWGGSQVK